MAKDEQIMSYMDLLLHTNRLFGWIYDEHMQMLFTTYPGDDYQGFDALFQLQVTPALNADLTSSPRFVYSFFNLAWLIDPEIVDLYRRKFLQRTGKGYGSTQPVHQDKGKCIQTADLSSHCCK